MRVAIVVAPAPHARPGDSQPPPSARGFRDTLARHRFKVVDLTETADLAADFARAIVEVSPGDDVLVYVAAWTEVRDGAADMLLPRDEQMPVRAMSDAVFAREAANVLFFVDARHDGDEGDALVAAEHADAIVRGLDARARGFGVLVGARSSMGVSTPSVWPFTAWVMRVLDDPVLRDPDGATRASRLYERVRTMSETSALVESFTFVPGRSDFAIGAPTETSVRISEMPPARSRPSSPPSSGAHARPHLTPLLLGADEAREREDWEEALDAYKKALLLVAPGDGGARATIYADIGEVKLAQEKPREAETNFEKALGAVPTHLRSLDALVEIATKANEWKRVAEVRVRRLAALKSDDARADELARIADIHVERLSDPRGAIVHLEKATALRPGDLALLATLRAMLEQQQNWTRVADVLGAMADAATGKERAQLRFERADVMLARLRDEPRGVELLELALADDPQHDAALHALIAVRTAHQEWRTIDTLYTRQIDRLAHLHDKERAWDACRKLGALRRDKLRDGEGAMEAFRGALECKPLDVDTRAMLAELDLAKHDETAAIDEFAMIAVHAPNRMSTFARLFALHTRAGRLDRAWLAAQALVELGSTDPDHHLAAEQYKPEGQIRPRARLDDAAWDAWLRAPGADDIVTGILGAIVPAAVKMKVAELRAAKKVVPLDPTRRQDPSSTASVVRSFAWASQVLGVTLPDLYVLDDVPGGIAAIQVETPSTAIGPDVMRGMTTQDLAFVAARHLAYYRPEHYALVFFPSIPELTALFLAAVKVALPEVPVPIAMGEAISRMRGELKRIATMQEREWLEAAVKALEERGGRVDLAAWAKSVELSAGRAGLLLCGDLAVAIKRIRTESRGVGDLTADDRRRDLLAFSASIELAALRDKLAVGTPSTMPPPPTSERR
jgi:tetratricopeptide (TPR) repeat protein